jgi:hypothetical protein
MVLEDVEASSLKAFFKNILQRVDDEGLKTADWKLLVGHYLVKAKYIALEWCDKDGPSSLDDYAPVSEGKLLVATPTSGHPRGAGRRRGRARSQTRAG